MTPICNYPKGYWQRAFRGGFMVALNGHILTHALTYTRRIQLTFSARSHKPLSCRSQTMFAMLRSCPVESRSPSSKHTGGLVRDVAFFRSSFINMMTCILSRKPSPSSTATEDQLPMSQIRSWNAPEFQPCPATSREPRALAKSTYIVPT